MVNHQETTAFIWSIADLLRGDYKQSEYGRVVLPFTVLRRLDCIQSTTKDQVLARAKMLPKTADPEMREQALKSASGHGFYNTSPFDFPTLIRDANDLADNLKAYVNAFSTDIRETVSIHFKFFDQVQRLEDADLLFRIVERFANIDLSPDRVTNMKMGYVFEELIRRFSEQSNETAGEHFTPREVIRLMVDLLFTEDGEALTQHGVIKTLYDPACGTGGMLSVAEDYLRDMAPDARLIVFGQELNGESYATCKSDMLIKGQPAENIAQGNTFTTDAHAGRSFDYMLSNPPFGVEGKKVEKTIRQEAGRGFSGRFGAGLPRVSDGSLLFLQHMISKFHDDAPSKLAIVLNGSPLFTGGAGSGESEIRRWVIEQDWLEAIVAMPDNLFYNTGISTYIWIVTNRKPARRKGRIQLIDGSAMWTKMRRSLGEKRKEIAEADIHRIAGHDRCWIHNNRHRIRYRLPRATEDQAKAGTDNTTLMTPRRTRQAVDDALEEALNQLQAAEEVGSYVLANCNLGGEIIRLGEITAGANLRPSNAGDSTQAGTELVGTWRAMGSKREADQTLVVCIKQRSGKGSHNGEL